MLKWIRRNFGSGITFSAVVIILMFILIALSAPLIAPYVPNKQNLIMRLKPPCWVAGGSAKHLLGTDNLGRDILSRLIYGSRVSICIGILAAVFSGILGTIIGLISGYYKSLDKIFMRLADIQLAFPSILLALAIVSIIGGSFWNMVLVLSLSGWVNYARVIRSEVLSLREQEYIIAARTINVSPSRLLLRHILPNILGSVMTIATFQIASAILTEASLTFLGIGIPVTTPTWGNMLQDGQLYVESAWWMSVFPGLCIALVVLSINLIGDLLRDKMNPRLKAKTK